MRRIIFVPILVCLALLAIGGGIAYLVYNNYTYYSTDDVQVTGPMINISSPTAGLLTALDVKQGDTVSAGQTIATVTTGANGGAATGNAVTITTPLSGVVLQTSAMQGQAVAPGLSILEVTNLNAVTLTAYVDEGAINNVKVGQDVDIHIDAYGDTSFSGKVQQIVNATADQFSLLPTTDHASGNFTKVGQRIPVIISLDGNGGKNVVPGMSAEVTIHIH